jgi:putative ABC transport system permease protein
MSRLSILRSYAIHDVLKSRGLFFLIVISMGVAFTAMITTASILEGFNNMLSEGAIGWLGDMVVQPEKGDLTIKNIDEIKKELDKIDEIKSYSARSYASIALKYKDIFYQPYKTIGVSVFDEEKTSDLKKNIIEGRFISGSESNEIVIGKQMAQALEGDGYGQERVGVGTEVDVVTQSGLMQKYKIVGIIDGKNFIPNWLIIFDKDKLEKLDPGQKDSEIAIKLENVKDIEDIEKVKSIIEDKNLAIRVYTWEEQSGYVKDILVGVSFITMLLNALVVVTVFVLVSIIIFINILQKRRQIGILKSMGASNKFVMGVYLFETLIYFFISSIIGFGMFYVINLYTNVYPMSMLIGDFHTVFDIKIIETSLLVMFIASFGGTLIPARMASKIEIADVIRDNT